MAGVQRVCLQSQLLNSDIEAYVRSHLLVNKKLNFLPSMQRGIEQRLTEGAGGM
jgi:hypothetical protein